MNILLINHYAGSIYHGMEYRPYYFAREWTRAGHKVTIVAASESHVRTNPPSTTDALTEEQLDGIRYVWLRTPAYSGNGVGRVRNISSFVLHVHRARNRVVKHEKPDVVIASSTYPLDIFPARTISRESNARLVFEVHDLWPLTLIEVGGMSRRHPFVSFLRHAEGVAYRSADRVISLLPKTQQYMESRGMPADRWRWIPNGIDPAEWNEPAAALPEEHECAIRAARDRGSFLVGYAGGHGVSNGLDTLVDAATRLKSCPIEFFSAGKGPERERLRARAREAHAHLLPPIPKAAIPALLSRMDALYLGFRDEPLYRFGVCPNKLMDYMMAAKPVIYAINGHDDTVERANCGWTIAAEDASSLAHTIVSASQLSDREREDIGLRGRKFVMEHRDYSVLARQFLEAVA